MVFERVAQPVRRALFEVGALPYAFLTAQRTWRDHGAELAALTRAGEGDVLLDLGCGPGVSAFGMVERVPGLRVTGLDVSIAMLRIARRLQRREPHGDRVTFVRGDAMSLPFADGAFQAAAGHSFLYLVPDAGRVMREVARVLAPGGRCAFLEPADGPGGARLPASLLRRAPREPRFVTSMALWRVVSRGYGRFDEPRFQALFTQAGLEVESVRPTLDGIGVFGVGRKPKAS